MTIWNTHERAPPAITLSRDAEGILPPLWWFTQLMEWQAKVKPLLRCNCGRKLRDDVEHVFLACRACLPQ